MSDKLPMLFKIIYVLNMWFFNRWEKSGREEEMRPGKHFPTGLPDWFSPDRFLGSKYAYIKPGILYERGYFKG